jgi:3'(2'), 5'-bisphosphate nucleotidase
MERAAVEGGAELMIYWKQEFDVRIKDDDSPVTLADTSSNDAIIRVLIELSGAVILSEESDMDNYSERRNSREIFVIDPLDGTKNFINQVGEFAVIIAYLYDNNPVIGVIYNPVTDVLYTAIDGEGAYRTHGGVKERIMVNNKTEFAQMSAVVSRVHSRSRTIRLLEDLGIGEILPMGGGGLKMCLVAEGSSGVYVNSTNKTGEWDTAAGVVIVREAGGKITDVLGRDLVFNKKIPNNPDGFVVTNGIVHDEVINKIRDNYLVTE